MTTLALGTLPPDKITTGAGLDSLARNLGNTLGIPLMTTYVIHREATHLTKLLRAQTIEHEGQGQALAALQTAFERAGEPTNEARARAQGIFRNQLIEGDH
jgi:DHA2 family multidrug resistance protein